LALSGVAKSAELGIIKRIDHTYFFNENAVEILNFLHDEFRLPVSWSHEAYGNPEAGEVSSGAVFAGNINLEFVSRNTVAQGDGIGFEPHEEIANVGRLLDEAGVPHFALPPWKEDPSRHDPGSSFWTVANEYLSENPEEPIWSMEGLWQFKKGLFFLLKYHVDVVAWKANLARKLDDVQGGPLGVVRVDQVIFEAVKSSPIREKFRPLCGDRFPAKGEAGLEFVEGASDCLRGFVLNVRSLERAKLYLSDKGWLRGSSNGHVEVDHPILGDILIRVVE